MDGVEGSPRYSVSIREAFTSQEATTRLVQNTLVDARARSSLRRYGRENSSDRWRKRLARSAIDYARGLL
jgi:hypothetical protein